MKKKIIFMNALFLLGLGACGNDDMEVVGNDSLPPKDPILMDYRPFVVEGKEWVCQETNPKDGPVGARGFSRTPQGKYLATYLIKGDTIIDGESCKKLWRKEEGGKFYVYCYLLERDRIVFNVHGENHSLIYDFGMTVGSTITSDDRSVTLEYVDTLIREGELYRRLHLTIDKDNNPKHQIWIEGVGSPCGPDKPLHRDLRMWEMNTCSLNGEVIFTSEDFTLPTWRDESK